MLSLQVPGGEKKEEEVGRRQGKTDWKWKEKSVAELYNYINSNKAHVPDSLAESAQQSFRTLNSQPETETGVRVDVEELEFENYISTIHDHIDEKDSNETESCFKDTIKAYLDLIDDRKDKDRSRKVVKTKSAVFTSNTSAIKDLIEENLQKDH